jgi:hypothetical protein
MICATYANDGSSSDIVCHDNTFPYLKKALSLLVHYDSDICYHLKNDQREFIVQRLYFMEHQMARVTMKRNQFEVAERHCQQSLAYARRFGIEGEEKITAIFSALGTYVDLRQLQYDDPGAVIFAEEAYVLVSEACDPVYPQVQEAAGTLINCLVLKGDIVTAERFAEQTYQNLRDKKNGIDQESEMVAKGAFNLANVIHRQEGDLK